MEKPARTHDAPSKYTVFNPKHLRLKNDFFGLRHIGRAAQSELIGLVGLIGYAKHHHPVQGTQHS